MFCMHLPLYAEVKKPNFSEENQKKTNKTRDTKCLGRTIENAGSDVVIFISYFNHKKAESAARERVGRVSGKQLFLRLNSAK